MKMNKKEKMMARLELMVDDESNCSMFFVGDNIKIIGQGNEKENDWEVCFSVPESGKIKNVSSRYSVLTIDFATYQYNIMSIIDQYNNPKNGDIFKCH